MESNKKRLSQKRLKELMDYDPETGIFKRLVSRGGVKAGSVAGCKDNAGYLEIMVDGKLYYAARLAFLWMKGYFPEGEAEHKDRDRSNNKWDNLREASRVCNMRNCGVRKNNQTGVTGVSWYKRSQKWVAHIRADGKQQNLGYFEDITKAIQARWQAEVKYGFPSCNTTSSAYQYLQNNSGTL